MLSDHDVQQFRNYFCNTQLFIADVLAVKSVIDNLHCQAMTVHEHSNQQSTPSAADLNTSQLHELLQKSAVEHLTRYRQLQLEVQDFGSLATVVTTDFEALYTYKHGDYLQCLKLSTDNVCTLLNVVHMPGFFILPYFIQLLDDNIVSLTALTLIVNPKCRDVTRYFDITQSAMMLYLMTQCQLKLHDSMTSLADSLDCIEVAERRCPDNLTLNHLTLKLTKCKVLTYMKKMHLI